MRHAQAILGLALSSGDVKFLQLDIKSVNRYIHYPSFSVSLYVCKHLHNPFWPDRVNILWQREAVVVLLNMMEQLAYAFLWTGTNLQGLHLKQIPCKSTNAG